MSPFFDVEQRDETDLGEPIAMRSFHLGGILLGDVTAPAQNQRRSNLKAGRQGVDHLVLQFYTRGRSEISTAGGGGRTAESRVVVVDMAQPIEMRSDRPVEAINLVVPRARLGDEAGPLDTLHGAALDFDADVAGKLLFDYLRGIILCCAQLAPHQLSGLTDAAVKLCAAFLRGAERGGVAGDLRRRIEVRRFIQDHLGRLDLDAAAIMREFGMSRPVLYREFAEDGGVMTYLRERRLAAAMRLLTRPASGGRAPRVSSVAYAVGFADEKSFSRAFKMRYGILPREVRGGDRASPPDGERAQLLVTWIKDLMG